MYKTAESVSPMHPDKICDRISDAILDACLEQDPNSRVAIETMGGHGIITITGELTTKAFVDMREIAQKIAGSQYGVQVNVVKQSPEIAQGVDTGGAGDQGIMIGYACNENEAMIPHELYLARNLCQFIFDRYPYDGKTQITLDEKNVITTIVASFQNVPKEVLYKLVVEWLGSEDGVEHLTIHCNPAGDWSQGGFEADTGLTGRKLAIDSYGTRVPLGGGAFSGKDATKVDRSGAYMARKIAVDLLKRSNAKEVIVKVAYAIGVEEPVMAVAEIDGVETSIGLYWLQLLKPKAIIDTLKLKEPQFEKSARWGHFGNKFNWDNE